MRLCEHCGEREVCYDGARFCGAACTARHEAGEPRAEVLDKLDAMLFSPDGWECLCGHENEPYSVETCGGCGASKISQLKWSKPGDAT